MKLSHAWVAITLIAGCGTNGSSGDDDPNNTGDVEDRSDDAFTIDPYGPEACGVLRVANMATIAQLDDTMGLTMRVATNIVGGRRYATTAALDAVPYVGPYALESLLEYAQLHGDVDACRQGSPPAG